MATDLQFPITPREFAAHYRIGMTKVLAWLDAGTLGAINVGLGTKKPRWRIRQIDVERFEAMHANHKAEAPPKIKRTRQEKRPEGYVQFFPHH